MDINRTLSFFNISNRLIFAVIIIMNHSVFKYMYLHQWSNDHDYGSDTSLVIAMSFPLISHARALHLRYDMDHHLNLNTNMTSLWRISRYNSYKQIGDTVSDIQAIYRSYILMLKTYMLQYQIRYDENELGYIPCQFSLCTTLESRCCPATL